VSYEPLVVWIREGYKQHCFAEYDLGNFNSLITNWQFQTQIDGFDPYKWHGTFSDFKSEIISEGVMTESEYEILMDSIRRLGYHLIRKSLDTLKVENTWSVLSMDIIVDKFKNPKILEINVNTNVSTNKITAPYWWTVFHEVLFLVDSWHVDGGKNWNPRNSQISPSWHLLVDETIGFEYTNDTCYKNPFPEF
jgi:hypothetical protein